MYLVFSIQVKETNRLPEAASFFGQFQTRLSSLILLLLLWILIVVR